MPNLNSITTGYFPVNSETYSSTISSTIGANVGTVPVTAATPYTDGDWAVLTVDPGTASQATFRGQKSGSSFVNCIWTEGNTGVGHNGGAIIQDYDSATHYGVVTKGLRTKLNDDATLKAFTESNIVPSAAVQNAAITPSKLATGASSAYVAANESTASTTYTDLTTTTDSVTVTIGANGLALVSVSTNLQTNTANGSSFMGFAVSGASTVTANDNMALSLQSYVAGGQATLGATFLVTGLTAGSNTFKAKYRSTNTGAFVNRRISVVPL